jgi:NRPS condensation-like uncharacterized protein
VWRALSDEQRRDAKRAKSWSNPTWDIPSEKGPVGPLTFRTAHITPEVFSALRAYGKLRDASVNDLLLTGVLRACIREFDPPAGVPLSLMCTADLRRYLPDADALPIANVSISGSLDIERVEAEPFEATLRRVREHMAAWARTCYGAGPFAHAEKLDAIGYRATKALLVAAIRMASRSRRSYPFFTNIGIIDDNRLAFDGVRPQVGHLFGPAALSGSVVPVASTYRDTLTLCMGYCQTEREEAMVRRVSGYTVDELHNRSAPV